MWAAGHAQNTGHDPNGRAQPLAHAAPLSVSHLLLGDCNDPKFMQILCTIYNQTTKLSEGVKIEFASQVASLVLSISNSALCMFNIGSLQTVMSHNLSLKSYVIDSKSKMISAEVILSQCSLWPYLFGGHLGARGCTDSIT